MGMHARPARGIRVPAVLVPFAVTVLALAGFVLGVALVALIAAVA